MKNLPQSSERDGGEGALMAEAEAVMAGAEAANPVAVPRQRPDRVINVLVKGITYGNDA